jgi:hypothetical protein
MKDKKVLSFLETPMKMQDEIQDFSKSRIRFKKSPPKNSQEMEQGNMPKICERNKIKFKKPIGENRKCVLPTIEKLSYNISTKGYSKIPLKKVSEVPVFNNHLLRGTSSLSKLKNL